MLGYLRLRECSVALEMPCDMGESAVGSSRQWRPYHVGIKVVEMTA